MNVEIVQAMEDCVKASDEESISFGDVVMKLNRAGVERYHADFLRSDRIFYMPCGASHHIKCHAVAATPSRTFSAEGVGAAVRAIQARTIGYREFCNRIVAAGCVGYIVSLAGERAVYYGRTGDSYVEPFPSV